MESISWKTIRPNEYKLIKELPKLLSTVDITVSHMSNASFAIERN